MGYKLIALDVDGTIRSIGSPIAERTRSAVAAARDAGAVVTLATGRSFGSAAANCEALGIEVPIATSQGAYVANPMTGEVLRLCPLSADMALSAIDALRPFACSDNIQTVAYHSGGIFVDKMSDWAISYGKRTDVDVSLVDDLRKIADKRLIRLVAVGADAHIKTLEHSLKMLLSNRMLITRSLPHFCEILHHKGGKEDALAWMCDYFDIKRSETVAFGNGYNDVQMLDWVSLGIAVGDAVPEALAAADRIAPPFEEHGVAQALEELVSKGLIG